MPAPTSQDDCLQASAKQLFFRGLDAFKEARFEDAERLFVASLEAAPGRVPTLLNLGAAQLKLQRPLDAIAAADALLAAQPQNVDAMQLRASALARLGLGEQAIAACDAALALDPGLADAWSQRGGLLREAGRLSESALAYEQAIALGRDTELNRYCLAAVHGSAPPAVAPAAYLEELFDVYSSSFDQHLVHSLGYRAPAVLAEGLRSLGPRRFASALDLGCGTGLCGALVKAQVDRLVGVDLSRHMLDLARERAVHDRLDRAELVAWLATSRETFELVVCTDVLIYIGDLEPVFAGVRRALGAAGVFCFSVERAGDEGVNFTLQPSLRYAHSERYVRELAARHGYAVAQLLHATIRHEAEEPIDGLYVYLAAG